MYSRYCERGKVNMMMREGQLSSRQAQTRSWREESNAGRCEMQMQDAGSKTWAQRQGTVLGMKLLILYSVTAQHSLLAVGIGVGRKGTSVEAAVGGFPHLTNHRIYQPHRPLPLLCITKRKPAHAQRHLFQDTRMLHPGPVH